MKLFRNIPFLATVCALCALPATAALGAPDDDIDALLKQAAADDARNAGMSAPAAKSVASPSALRGFAQVEFARTVAAPTHWSKLLGRVEFGTQGKTDGGLKWKLSARADYDAVYSANNFYNADVRHDRQFNLVLRENYIDVGLGNWDLRLGRQHVIWGEMVGLFFADVVSARDLRQFILPEFDMLRTPQWAARAEYFKDDFHAELVWIPLATFDEIGKPGTEFYPYQPVLPGFVRQYRNEVHPSRRLDNGNYGVRLSTLTAGWDVSGFYYRSHDIQPTFYRQVSLAPPTMIFEPRHDRISQIGGTLTKEFDLAVLKSEAVYTRGRRFGVLNPLAVDGVVAQNTLDWAAGLDFTLPADTRFNVQLFQRVFFDHNPGIIPEKRENGYTLYLNKKFGGTWEAQATWISSMNRTDWLFRPRLQWDFEKNWRLLMGADVFKGPQLGFFGQYSNRDRVYSEVRYSF